MKKILLGFLILIGLFFCYSLVFSDSSIKIKNDFKSGKNFFLDSGKLNSIILSFESNKDLSDYNFYSVCNVKSTFIQSIKNKYYFKIKFLDHKCFNSNLILKDIEKRFILNIDLKFKFINDIDIYHQLLDYSDKELEGFLDKITILSENLYVFSKYRKGVSDDILTFLYKNRKYHEYGYYIKIIKDIIENRSNRYISPVPGYKISNNYSKLPNAGRPYRKEYTDGIHHGWDINAPYGTKVVSLDKAIVIRVVDNYGIKESSKIKKNLPLTYDDKLVNLDLLRGNQVWIKTMKGQIIFYSHLSEIYSNIKIGSILEKGDSIGEIGISGIPGKNYRDYHLHFSIHENPYLKYKSGKYTFLDYMKWDWKFKGKSRDYILSNTNKVFQ